jgi:WD40 repeat protein
LFDLKSHKKQGTLVGHEDFSFGTDFHPDGYTAVTANQDLTARIWDLRTYKETNKLLSSNNSMSSVKFLDNGKYLVAGENMSYLNVYSTANYKLRTEIDYFGQLLGFDTLEDKGDKLYMGITPFYGDVRGGIVEIDIGDKSSSK